MEKCVIIYQIDEEYIEEITSFFNFYALKEKANIEFYKVKWDEKIKPEISKFNKAIILSLLGKREIKTHKEISHFLTKHKIFQINPFSCSFKADDKYFTISKLKKNGISVPESLIIKKGEKDNIETKIEEFLDKKKLSFFYIQPNFGTEGRETYFFSKEEFKKDKNYIIDIIKNILQSQSVIIKEKRGNVYFYKEEEKGYRNITFRIFIWQFNSKIENNYGFAEVSKDEKSFITSPEKGGKIISFSEGLKNIYYNENGSFKRLVLTEEEIKFIKSETIKLYKCFNKGAKEQLLLCGIDFLLEYNGKKVFPLFLEINPRPAGINRCTEIV